MQGFSLVINCELENATANMIVRGIRFSLDSYCRDSLSPNRISYMKKDSVIAINGRTPSQTYVVRSNLEDIAVEVFKIRDLNEHDQSYLNISVMSVDLMGDPEYENQRTARQSSPSGEPMPQLDGWDMVFYDEFNTTNFNPTKWTRFDGTAYDSITQWQESLVSNIGGVAVLQSKFVSGVYRTSGFTTNVINYDFTEQTRWDMRFKIQRANALALDINVLQQGTNTYNPNFIIASDKGGDRSLLSSDLFFGSDYKNGNKNADYTQWHTLTMIIGKSTLNVSIDGELFNSITPTGNLLELGPLVITFEFTMTCNPATNATCLSDVSGTDKSVNMSIDWIAIQRQTPISNTSSTSESTTGPPTTASSTTMGETPTTVSSNSISSSSTSSSTATSNPISTMSATSQGTSAIPAIIGGSVAGIVVIIPAVVVCFVCVRRRRSRNFRDKDSTKDLELSSAQRQRSSIDESRKGITHLTGVKF